MEKTICRCGSSDYTMGDFDSVAATMVLHCKACGADTTLHGVVLKSIDYGIHEISGIDVAKVEEEIPIRFDRATTLEDAAVWDWAIGSKD